MPPWNRHVRDCRDTAGVGTRARAAEVGVHPRTWLRRCAAEGWARPYEGIAIAPWVTDHDAAVLAAVAAAHRGAACGETARWWHRLGPRPRKLAVAIPHGHARRTVRRDPPPPPRLDASAGPAERAARAAERRAAEEQRRWHVRCRLVEVRRSRWLTSDDVEHVAGVPVLSPVATAISLASTHPEDVRAYLIDARQAGKLELDSVADRLAAVGPVRGRHVLRAALEALEGRRPESAFHDEVLTAFERRGYRPTRHAIRLTTPRGRDLNPDIALEDHQVAVELEGDRYHRDRDARRRDRERASAYASTDWVVILVDHQTWMRNRPQIFADVDAAIDGQLRRGIGPGQAGG